MPIDPSSQLLSDSYVTVSSPGQGLYKEKGSRFISFVFHADTFEQVRLALEAKRREFHDARHVCHAYRINPSSPQAKGSDDGEPSGTAARPMLGCLLSHGLVNAAVIVVRYFGGVKLGTSGLANAYKLAAEDAIANCSIQQRTIDVAFSVRFDYVWLNDVMRIVKELRPVVLAQNFDSSCSLSLSVRLSGAEALQSRLSKVQSLVFVNEEDDEQDAGQVDG